MTATVTQPVETVARPRLDRYRNAAVAYDASLDAVLAYLRELSTASVEDLAPGSRDDDMRYPRAFGHLTGSVGALADILCRQIDAEVRAAPSSWLAEIVRDSLQPCAAPTCDQSVAPYAEVHCSPECAAEAFAAFGSE